MKKKEVNEEKTVYRERGMKREGEDEEKEGKYICKKE